ncbi:polyisoprenoid-binding protein [Oligella ureolytica]
MPADLFDTEKFPTATFKSTKVNFESDAPKTIEGDLTIKGITKPVVLEVYTLRQYGTPYG